jgi:hypothetical protein
MFLKLFFLILFDLIIEINKSRRKTQNNERERESQSRLG